MTTATAPPLLDPPSTPDADLAPLLDDRERACELADHDTGQSCQRPAAWMLVCDAADCGHFRGPVLVCAPCQSEIAAADTLVMCPADGCLLACYVRWMERI